MSGVKAVSGMWYFVWNWTSLYFPFSEWCGGLNQNFLPDLLLMAGWSSSLWALSDCLSSLLVTMTRELLSQRQNWGAPWGRPWNVYNFKFMAKIWHFRGKQRSHSRPWRKLGLEVTHFIKLKVSGSCSKLWPWDMIASRLTGVGRDGSPPAFPGSIRPGLVGREEDAVGSGGGKGPLSPHCAMHILLLSLPL